MTRSNLSPLSSRRVRKRKAAVVDRLPDTGGGRVLILTAAVGAGHDGAAYELARRLGNYGVDVDVRDWLDALPGFGRFLASDCYGPTVQHAPQFFDWLFTGIEHRRWVRFAVVSFCRLSERTVQRWSTGANVVVSTYPLSSQTLGRLRVSGRLEAPAVTFLTDPAAHWLWCHPAVDLHLTVTRATVEDGHRYGVAFQAVGALTQPRFSLGADDAERSRVRRELGVTGAEPIALIAAGSLGLGSIHAAVKAVLVHPSVRVVVLCGRNEALRQGLAGDRVTALGWRDDVPELMAAADVLIHNAGGLSFTEALVAGLPAITYLAIPGHGKANARVLAAAGLAAWPQNPAELAAAIDNAASLPRPRSLLAAQRSGPDAAAVLLELLDLNGFASAPPRAG
jgi:processive 1,2-diacylglycerol beta-glucosyltransferase